MNAAIAPKLVSSEVFRQVMPGCALSLEFLGGDLPRISAKLIGFELDKYLIVRLDDNNVWTRYAPFLLPNSRLVARLVIENRYGECLAFRCSVRWQGHHPLDFLYLSFPDSIQKVELRKHTRVPTALTAVLTDTVNLLKNGRRLTGYISDVSLGGCRFEFPLPEDRVAVSPRPVQIQVGKNILFKGDIKNQRNGPNNRIAVGMQFLTSEKDTKTLLSALYIAPELLTTH